LTEHVSAGRLTKSGRLAIVVYVRKKKRTGRANPMTEQNLTSTDIEKIDDTEGHFRRDADDIEDDTEGHARRDAGQAEDDVEGHFRRDAEEADDAEDDVEGHFRRDAEEADDAEDDVEGHFRR
jgi:hypothetical protein